MYLIPHNPHHNTVKSILISISHMGRLRVIEVKSFAFVDKAGNDRVWIGV